MFDIIMLLFCDTSTKRANTQIKLIQFVLQSCNIAFINININNVAILPLSISIACLCKYQSCSNDIIWSRTPPLTQHKVHLILTQIRLKQFAQRGKSTTISQNNTRMQNDYTKKTCTLSDTRSMFYSTFCTSSPCKNSGTSSTLSNIGFSTVVVVVDEFAIC